MSLPPSSELELAAKKFVWDAKRKGNLKEYTPRLVRQTLEKEYKLEEGTLDEAEYKSKIKAAMKAALSEPPPPISEDEQSPKKKRKSDDTVPGDNKKAKSTLNEKDRKLKAGAKAESDVDERGGSTKKRKTAHRKSSAGSDKEVVDKHSSSKPRVKGREKQKEKSFKSLEHVPTSDMEQDEPDPSSSKGDKPKTPSSTSKIVVNYKPKSKDRADSKKEDSGMKSESELSVLDDEPPKKKRSKSGDKELKKTIKAKAKKEIELTKDEETIKRLKSLVVACGVRKVWSKVFQGIDTPQLQIKKLKEILAGLGMTGRMSMDQAKAIKERRELAQELEEVQAFAKAIEARDSGDYRKSEEKTDKSGSEEAETDSDNESSNVPSRKRPMNARKSITAFLQDQSSDDE